MVAEFMMVLENTSAGWMAQISMMGLAEISAGLMGIIFTVALAS